MEIPWRYNFTNFYRASSAGMEYGGTEEKLCGHISVTS